MYTNAAESTRGNLKINRANVVVCFIIAAVIYNTLFQYCNMSIIRETPDRLVNGSIDQVIGRVYTDNRCLTRKEVILTVFDLFFQLKQTGFEKTEDPNVTFGQALEMGVLKGDGNNDYHLKDPAKKEEAMAIVGRCLGIPDYLETQSVFPEEIDCSDWAKQPVEKLIEQGCLSVNEIMGLGDLHQTITVSDLKFVLSKVAEVQIDELDSWRNTVLSNPVSHIIVSIASLLLSIGVVTIIEIVLGENHNRLGEEQNQQKEVQQRQEAERTRWEDKQKQWEAERTRWEDEQKQWEAERARWEDEQKRWAAERARWEDEQKQWEAERARWEDKQKQRKKSEKGKKKSKNNGKQSGQDGKKKKDRLSRGFA